MAGPRALGEPLVEGVQRDVHGVGAHLGSVEHEEGLRQRVPRLAPRRPRAPGPQKGHVERLAVEDLAALGQQRRALQDEGARERARGEEHARALQADPG